MKALVVIRQVSQHSISKAATLHIGITQDCLPIGPTSAPLRAADRYKVGNGLPHQESQQQPLG